MTTSIQDGRCIWAGETDHNLVAITATTLGPLGQPKGERKLGVCPEHVDESKSYFERAMRHGVWVSIATLLVMGAMVTIIVLRPWHMFPVHQKTWIFAAIATVPLLAALLPYSSVMLGSKPLAQFDGAWGVRNRMMCTRIAIRVLGAMVVLLFLMG